MTEVDSAVMVVSVRSRSQKVLAAERMAVSAAGWNVVMRAISGPGLLAEVCRSAVRDVDWRRVPSFRIADWRTGSGKSRVRKRSKRADAAGP